MDEKYIQFKNTLRADVKLRISLEEYLNAKETEKKSHGIQEYREYLSKRRRSAWGILVREENLDGFRVFAEERWLTGENAEECLKIASQMGKKESQLWLLSYIKNGVVNDADEISDKGKEEHIKEIFALLTAKLQAEIPAFASAFPGLIYRKAKKTDLRKIVWGTDGNYLYYSPEEMIEEFLQGTDRLVRRYLHTAFHCLYLHVIPREKSDLKEPISDQIWDLACDVAAEWALDESQWYPLESDRRKRRDLWYRMILNEEKGRDTLSCYR